MSWVKLDDAFFTNPKVTAVHPLGRLLYMAGLCYSAAGMTDGRITKGALPLLLVQSGAKKSSVADLVEAGLWIERDNGWEVHDFLRFNPSKEQVLAERRSGSRRQALHNDGELKHLIRLRDGDRCRYCGQKVNWRDRKGSHGGTYDHIDPEGENTAENVVVACRGCNAKKGHRTPEAAGMNLLPIHLETRSKQIQANNDLLYPSRPDHLPPSPPQQADIDGVVPFAAKPPDELRSSLRVAPPKEAP